MSNKDLLKKWQKRLGLEKWTIILRDNCVTNDFNNPNNVGEVIYQETTKTAIIHILKPECYGEQMIPFNFEQTLLHELLHLKFSLLDDSDNPLQNRIVHILIEDLAKAFYETETAKK